MLALAGCSSSDSAAGSSSQSLGVIAQNVAPAEVAGVHTFYVMPNNQVEMSNTFDQGAPLQQIFAERLATRLTERGLVQAPMEMANATVSFSVKTPRQAARTESGDTQSLAYADQLLAEAKAMGPADDFLKADRVDMTVSVTSTRTNKEIWRGSISGVLPAGEGTRDRLQDMLDAVDRLMKQYPNQ
jgi:hypothetical protein